VQLGAGKWRQSQSQSNQSVPEKPLAGGHEFTLPGGVVGASNLSSDTATGIGNRTQAQFIAAPSLKATRCSTATPGCARVFDPRNF